MNEPSKESRDCGNENHSEHLCNLMHSGWFFEHRQEYKALVKNAEFICEYCSRTAQHSNNLCHPVEL
jgi:hypothetical protein